jgi:uncharacterized membrane protein
VLQILAVVKQIVDILAIVMILYGVALALIRIAKIESRVKRQDRFRKYENAKRIFLQKMVFALDFFVVSTLLGLVTAVTTEDFMKIGLIVAIRTILSWSMNVELHEENNH